MKLKKNDIVKLNFEGKIVSARIISTWAKMKDKVGVKILDFNYMWSNFRQHIVNRKDIIK